MPILSSSYKSTFPFRNTHISTIYSGLIRKVDGLQQQRERITLADGDFLDLDWSYASKQSEKVVILLHGLEGHGQRPYITGSAKQFNDAGYDACAVNFRGCSGETNKLFRSYHSGATEDLHAVVEHLLSRYPNIYIKGFSLGGNMLLKYLGEGRDIPKQLKAGIAVSVPCDLHDSLIQLLKPFNLPYAIRFRKHLVAKLWAKRKLFPELLSEADIRAIKNLKDFDDIYTSRAHGFRDALDYYQRCSSLQFLTSIKRPALILNARNDSFLGDKCYPEKEANINKLIYLEMPRHGGHVGFHHPDNIYYNEWRAINFLNELA